MKPTNTENTQNAEPGNKKFNEIKKSIPITEEDIREKLDQLKNQTAEYQEVASEIIEAISEYVKKNPQRASIYAGLGGLTIGIIAGLLLRRK